MTFLAKHILSCLTVALLLGYSYAVPARKITLKSGLGSDSILIGDQVGLFFEVEQPKGLNIVLPGLPDTIAGVVEVLERMPVDTVNLDDAMISVKQAYTITCFDSGQYVIPPFPFLLRYDQLMDTIESKAMSLTVLSIDVDLNKGPVDIKKPFEAPVTFKEAAPWIFGILIAGALIFFLFYAIHRRKKNMPIFSRPEKPKEPAHIIALRELDILKEKGLCKIGQVKEYYSRISEIIRTYIEDRFEVPAMEQTSHEILSDMREGEFKVDGKSLDELESILELSDLVKFAKLSPSEDDNQITIAKGYFFVQHTKIEDIKEPEEDKGETETGETIAGEDVTVSWEDNKK